MYKSAEPLSVCVARCVDGWLSPQNVACTNHREWTDSHSQTANVKGELSPNTKLVERKIQGLVSSCRKPTVQRATEAGNRQRVVQTIPRMYTKSYSLKATTLGLTIPSAPNAPKIQRDMIYELIQEGSPSEVVLPQSILA